MSYGGLIRKDDIGLNNFISNATFLHPLIFRLSDPNTVSGFHYVLLQCQFSLVDVLSRLAPEGDKALIGEKVQLAGADAPGPTDYDTSKKAKGAENTTPEGESSEKKAGH